MASSTPSAVGLVARSLMLGCAAGSRGSLAVAGPVLFAPSSSRTRRALVGRLAAGAAVVGELVGDKLPTAPSRLDPPGPASRMIGGGLGGVLLARRRGAGPGRTVAAALAGVAGAAIGTWGGAAWRRLSVGKRPDWPGAVAEDVVALGLAAAASRG